MISEIDFAENNYVRIELGISLNSQRTRISKKIKSEYTRLGIKTVGEEFHKPFWKRLFRDETVAEYLGNDGIGNTEIEEFFKYVAQSKEEIKKEDRFNELAEQQQRAVNIFLLSRKYPKILIETAGMYLTISVLTYLIIKDYIENDGHCVEIAYPHFEPKDELGSFVADNPEVIKLGEMKMEQTPLKK